MQAPQEREWGGAEGENPKQTRLTPGGRRAKSQDPEIMMRAEIKTQDT